MEKKDIQKTEKNEKPILKSKAFWKFAIFFHVFQIFMCAKTHAYHADEYGQGTEMIYHRVYGEVSNDYIAWEWKEDALRNVLFLEFYAIPLRIIKFLNWDSNIIVRYFCYFE